MEIFTYLMYAIGFAAFGLMIHFALPLYRSGSTMSIWKQLGHILVLSLLFVLVLGIFVGDADELSELFNETTTYYLVSGAFSLLALRSAQTLYQKVQRFDYRQLIEYVAINLGSVAGFFVGNIINYLLIGDELIW